jgi:phage I-like protein
MFLLTLEDSNLPTELRVFAFGENPTRKGKLMFDEQSAQECMAAYLEHGAELPFDWDHAMLDRGQRDPKMSGEAAGWFKLELKEDGLWAVDVRFTEEAAAAIKAGKWRYYSPAVLCDKRKRVTRLINMALTNLPATDNMDPLVAKETHSMKDTLCVTLGLKEDLADEDVIKHLVELNTHQTEVLSLTGKSCMNEALGVLQAWRAGYEQNVNAQVQLEKANADRLAAEKKALIDTNKAKIPPSMREWANAQSIETLSAFVAVAPDLVTMSEAAPVEPAKDKLTDFERRIVKSFGISEDDYIATKNAQRK